MKRAVMVERTWKRIPRLAAAVVLSAAIVAAAPAAASTASALPTPKAAVVVPDRFLRAWDPVTVFFDHDLGPAGGGPEDDAGRLVRIAPEHPGAFTWLDGHTLQFRPAEAWPPLQRYTWTVQGRSFTLATLFVPPVATAPRDKENGLAPVEAVRMVFQNPVEPEALRAMLTIELRPLPGLSSSASRFLNAQDFDIRALEPESRADQAIYVAELRQPIPPGTRALLHFRLSLDTDAPEAGFDVSFSTAEPFRALRFGCRGESLPVSPDGVRYGREQPLRCADDQRSLVVQFSAAPAAIGPVEARNLVRIDPAVPNFAATVSGQELEITGDFARDTLYRVTLAPAALRDESGRGLEMRRESEAFVFFPQQDAFLRWGAGQGIVERFGPQMAPLEGRGNERVDLRVQRIEPLDRSFWPFPASPVELDEAKRPAGPGEEPRAWTAAGADIGAGEIASRIRALGSPAVSTLVTLPLRREGSAARFGVDLAPQFEKVQGKGAPGTYLVGLRRLDRSSTRAWVRLQVTDLSLSTLEEDAATVFAVTSLATAEPVAGAEVRVEGRVEESGSPVSWETLWSGSTDVSGRVRWPAPGKVAGRRVTVRRIVAAKGDDILVLDPERGPDVFHDGQWDASNSTWLAWTQDSLSGRGAPAETVGHLFTDRPVYRPEEAVHIKGYLRVRDRGELRIATPEGRIIVTGPGDLVWRFPTTVTAQGSIYHKFSADKLPTGVYSVAFEDKQGHRLASTSFRMEAYRLPRFEVQLQAAERVPLDKEFPVALLATYYAGGRVAARPIQWRVTQFPYTWTPPAAKLRPGFLYSSDGRFSRTERFESAGKLEKQDATDAEGAATLTLNPAIEATAQPRSYVVEATVTGEDDQTVTATRQVLALPPFVLGVKLPRYLDQAKEIAPEVVVVGPAGEPLSGQAVTVRLLHRQWHSVLRASDFTDGVARYLTDVVDDKVAEQKITSGAEPVRLAFPIHEAGVYLVEVEAADRLGRSQIVAADLYAGGAGPVAWAKAPQGAFNASPDKPRYAPGDTANVVLQSPFQKAAALAVVEAPEGNRYEWLRVEAGAATVHVPILGTYAPRLAVHVLLLRGRLPGSAPQPGNTADLGKPSAVATTVWLDVEPVSNRVAVELKNPERARPGQKIEVEIHLHDEKARPLPGEVTLWLVDQAVLALGREQRLDPLPDFIRPVTTHFDLRDTRNLAFGFLPFAENPGGESAERDESGLLDRATVRRSFQPVPYFNPAIEVGPDGTARVTIGLPDNLTNFKLRAKAASGPDRFGFGTGQVAVRLPVIVQPALPRFVRPGDSFLGAAIGRIVEGEGGKGAAKVEVKGVTLVGYSRREIQWTKNKPERVEFEVKVPTPPYRDDGELAYDKVSFKVAVARDADGASDAFEVEVPVQDDRQRITLRKLGELQPGGAFALPDVPVAARQGSVRRSLMVSDQPALVKMATGLDLLRTYPYGCTEQRLSTARAELALRGLRTALHTAPQTTGDDSRTDRAVTDTLQWLPSVVDKNGLCAYWPGGDGYVWLTAYAAEFLHEAKAAGYPVDGKLLANLMRTLDQSLRSDFGRFIDGEAYDERSAALYALTALGSPNASYAAELGRQPQFLNLEATARIVRALGPGNAATQSLTKKLWDGVVFRLYQGREVYGGLQETGARSPLILPSETRTLAEVTRTLAAGGGTVADPRLQRLVDGLVGLGAGDGWGTTNANAAALLALTEIVKPPFAGTGAHGLEVRLGEAPKTLKLGPEAPVASFESTAAGKGEVGYASGSGTLLVRAETTYLPAADGGQEAPAANGFVISRELLRVQSDDAPAVREALTQAGRTVEIKVGDVLEDHVQVVNPKDRNFVAIVVPLAAGVEPLNAALATAPPEAAPQGRLTRQPTYVMFLDDRVAYFYDALPKGTFDFYFRTRATTAGNFVQPAARGELMYDAAVRGNSAGARVLVTRGER